MTRRFLVALLLIAASLPAAAPKRLRVAIVQMSIGATLEVNRDRIVSWIPRAAATGARVVVFPEGALSARSDAPEGDVPAAVRAIAEAVRRHDVYVLFGGWTWSGRVRKSANWMKVIAPDGRELLHYDKLWDIHDAPDPAVFSIDGVPASAIICADRWLRGLEDLPIQRGAVVSFELSNNFASEWVPGLEWYWYVPRALRNSAFVVFANTGNRTPGKSESGVEMGPRHGHSAVIAPDGGFVARSRDDLETIVTADLDLSKATRAQALARSAHPALAPFWKAALDRENLPKKSFVPMDSPEAELTVAAAQIPDDLTGMEQSIREAARRKADLVALPLLDASPSKADSLLERVSRAARESGVIVAYATERAGGERVYRSGYVVGSDGKLLTRHDQLSAAAPLAPGAKLSTMWFRIRSVPAIVSVGSDALWNEVAELAAVAGARLHINIAGDPVPGPEAALRRRQTGAALASFMMFTVMVNRAGPAAGRSAIWDDLSARDETRAEVRGLPRPDSAALRVYSPFSANLVAEAGESPELLIVTRRVPGPNDHYPARTARYHPAMTPWYVFGAELLSPPR